MKWFTDNQNVVRIMQVGSKTPHLQEGAISISKFAYSIPLLQMEWIPLRTKNELADYTNRIVDFDDWQVSPSVFSMIDVCGDHTRWIDLLQLKMHSWFDLIERFGAQGLRQSMLLPLIGALILTCLCLHCI